VYSVDGGVAPTLHLPKSASRASCGRSRPNSSPARASVVTCGWGEDFVIVDAAEPAPTGSVAVRVPASKLKVYAVGSARPRSIAFSSLKRLVKRKVRWSYHVLSLVLVCEDDGRVCRARCARCVILLFALSVASGNSPAHDGDAIGRRRHLGHGPQHQPRTSSRSPPIHLISQLSHRSVCLLVQSMRPAGPSTVPVLWSRHRQSRPATSQRGSPPDVAPAPPRRWPGHAGRQSHPPSRAARRSRVASAGAECTTPPEPGASACGHCPPW
jgi:hypothetical protein